MGSTRYFSSSTHDAALLRSALLVGALFLVAACGREDGQIRVYRLVKAPLEPEAAAAAAAQQARESGMAGGGQMPELPPDHPPIGGGTARVASSGPSSAAAPSVPVPENWTPQALSEMRKASYLVRGPDETTADVSFVTLGGSAGDVLGNVNRWLGQINQPPLKPEQLAEVVQHLPGPSGHVAIVDLKGTPEGGDPKKDGRILAAIATGEGSTAFFKMRGNHDLVGTEKEKFLQWVNAMRQAP